MLLAMVFCGLVFERLNFHRFNNQHPKDRRVTFKGGSKELIIYEICIKSMSVKRGDYMLMKLMKQFFFLLREYMGPTSFCTYILCYLCVFVCVYVCVCVCVFVYSVMGAHMPILTQCT